MEVILKKTKITASVLKQTLRSTSADFLKGEILGWCVFGNAGKYIVCYRSDTNGLSIFPMFKDIKTKEIEDKSWTIDVIIGGNYLPIKYTCSDEKDKEDSLAILKKQSTMQKLKVNSLYKTKIQMTKMQSIIKTCLEGKPSDVGLDNWPDFAWEMQSRALEEIKQQAINFAESIEFAKYEKFEGQENLWYDKNSTHYKPILAKTTEQLWKEYCAKLIRENLTK